MEAFSLLKYWRGGGTIACVNTRSTATCTTTIVTAATPNLAVDTDYDDVDDGPFFDLEFAVPNEDGTEENEDNVEDEESLVSNDDVDTNSDGGCSGPQFRVSFLKSASKVGIFLLWLKKSASNGTVTPKKQEKAKEPNSVNNKNKFFTVKLKVEEVPIMSLFSKDNKSHKQKTSENSVSDVMQRYLKKVKPHYVRENLRF
ncbi:probable membrane-associated kinase regulator 2 [Hibiscus syriacus]|uniref:probable membrane-associated kinase regulator 2 n=1 Tax=Hibiscus syriacus TaxID=106335 RepID=UPI001922D4E8|nr:probable membrane-associated kinase regulator 2 [Hibiscus syriacus]